MARDEINAFLGTGTVYEGKLNFQGSVRIDGIFTGEVESEGTLIIGKDAKVQGTIFVGQLVLSGNFEGEVRAERKVVLHKTANLVGSLNTPVLVIEEGAVVEGKITMGAPASKADKKVLKKGTAAKAIADAAGDSSKAAGESPKEETPSLTG